MFVSKHNFSISTYQNPTQRHHVTLGSRHDIQRMNNNKAKCPTVQQLHLSGGLHVPRKAVIAAMLKRYDKMEHPVYDKMEHPVYDKMEHPVYEIY